MNKQRLGIIIVACIGILKFQNGFESIPDEIKKSSSNFSFPFVSIPQVQKKKEENKNIDLYLEKYETAILFFEENIKDPYSISLVDITQLNKLIVDFNDESNNLERTDSWSDVQIKRYIKLTKKLTWSIYKLSSVVEIFEKKVRRY